MLLLLAAYHPALALRLALPRPEAKSIFDAAIAALVSGARVLTDAVHNGSLQRGLLLAILVMLAVGVSAFLGGDHAAGVRAMIPATMPAIAVWLLAVAAALAVLRYHRHRLLALVLTSIVGLVVSLTFVYFSAPDLALTQLSVEVVTTVLMLLALNYLPQKTPREPSRLRHWRDLAVAAAGGLAIGATLFAVLTRDLAQTIATWQIAESKPGGGGTNVVNVILVDFRGYDTFGEIIVLGIAALAIFALLDSALGGASGQRLQHMPHRREAGDRHPLMLVVVTRALLPLALTVGVYILLRGHNLPGGGFIAGLIIGVALIMQYMASGYAWADKQMRVDYHALIGLGVLLAGVTGVGAWYRRPAVPHQRLRLFPPAAGRRGRARHRHGVRPRRVPDRGRRGHADPGQPLAGRPQGGAAAGGRGADGHRPAGGGPVDGVPGRQRRRARHRGRHLPRPARADLPASCWG